MFDLSKNAGKAPADWDWDVRAVMDSFDSLWRLTPKQGGIFDDHEFYKPNLYADLVLCLINTLSNKE